jgi:hypothetical protein
MCREAEGVMRSNMTLMERQADLLKSYLDTHGLDHDTALQREMIARYHFESGITLCQVSLYVRNYLKG